MALAVACSTWLEEVGMTDCEALRLAPPILGVWQAGGSLASREAVTVGLTWSLPPADGVAVSDG